MPDPLEILEQQIDAVNHLLKKTWDPDKIKKYSTILENLNKTHLITLKRLQEQQKALQGQQTTLTKLSTTVKGNIAVFSDLGKSVLNFVQVSNPALAARFAWAVRDLAAAVGKLLEPALQRATKWVDWFNEKITETYDNMKGNKQTWLELIGYVFTVGLAMLALGGTVFLLTKAMIGLKIAAEGVALTIAGLLAGIKLLAPLARGAGIVLAAALFNPIGAAAAAALGAWAIVFHQIRMMGKKEHSAFSPQGALGYLFGTSKLAKEDKATIQKLERDKGPTAKNEAQARQKQAQGIPLTKEEQRLLPGGPDAYEAEEKAKRERKQNQEAAEAQANAPKPKFRLPILEKIGRELGAGAGGGGAGAPGGPAPKPEDEKKKKKSFAPGSAAIIGIEEAGRQAIIQALTARGTSDAEDEKKDLMQKHNDKLDKANDLLGQIAQKVGVDKDPFGSGEVLMGASPA